MIQINRTKAINLLEQAVADRGPEFGYVHPDKVVTHPETKVQAPMNGCWYEVNGAPSCGVGLALHLAGVPLTVLDALDQADGDTSLGAVAWILEDNGVHLTQDAVEVFTKFQEHQDLYDPWGVALEAAKKEI